MLEALKEIGLSEVEIKVYKILIIKGEQTILEISKNANINRSYCYEILERLLRKGFITKLIVDKKIFWKPSSKESVLAYLEEISSKIDKDIEELNKKKEKKKYLEIKTYRGKRGVKQLLDKISVSKTKVLGFGTEDNLRKHFPYYINHFFKKIKENKTAFELVCLKDNIPLATSRTKYKSFKKSFESSAEISVHEDKTIIFFWGDNLEAIEIENEDIANTFRNYHKIFWNNLDEKVSK